MAASRSLEVRIVGDTKDVERAFARAQKQSSVFEKGLRSASIGAAAALGAIGVAAKVGFGELADASKVAAQTGAVIKSTGGVANVTAAHVDKLANALLNKSGVDDEAIKSGQNMLLTFTRIRNEVGQGNNIFDQATQATLNLSVAMGKDMQSSAILVGKALNDPVKGMSALSRAGIQFTAQQKDTIKALVASGDTMAAQKMILKELETQFGGSAEAAGKTFAGQISIAKEQAKNFAAEIVAGAAPALRGLATGLSAATGFMAAHQTATKVIIGVIAGLAVGVLAVSAALKAYAAAQAVATAAQWAFNAALNANPVGLVVVAVAALAAGLVVAYKRSETFRDVVNGAFAAVKTVVATAVNAILGLIDRYLSGLQAVAEAASRLPLVGDKFRGVADRIGDARDRVQQLQAAIDGLKSKEITVTTTLRTYGSQPIVPGVVGHRAAGGPVDAGFAYLVGERGPELFVPGANGTIVPNGGSSGPDREIVVPVTLEIDGQQLAQIVRRYQLRDRRRLVPSSVTGQGSYGLA